MQNHLIFWVMKELPSTHWTTIRAMKSEKSRISRTPNTLLAFGTKPCSKYLICVTRRESLQIYLKRRKEYQQSQNELALKPKQRKGEDEWLHVTSSATIFDFITKYI